MLRTQLGRRTACMAGGGWLVGQQPLLLSWPVHSQLSDKIGVDAERMLSVGNSFKSDIAPALSAGYHAIHIPFHVVWELEQTDEFEHERLRRIERFEEIERIMKNEE